MECNKEEAIRAKDIAGSKMLAKDFPGARKIALKAQRIYEDVENISQMLLVCDVHCAAEQKLFGNEMDWYGILQVDHMADEVTIKKQYRKLALQLHPDKNKFPGAEAAFKLIGEAQRVLLDKGKRSLHDIKRKASVNKPAPPYRSHPVQRTTNNPSFGVQNNFNNNFMGFNSQHHQPQRPTAQQGFSNGRPTFWTACPFCNVKYQYYIEVINKSLICQSCTKPFVAYERSVQGAPSSTNFTQPVFPRKDVPNQGVHKVHLGQRGNIGVGHSKTEFFPKNSSSEFQSAKVDCKKRRKRESESSESCDTESSIDTEEEEEENDVVVGKDDDFKAAQNFSSYAECPRRSDRRRQKVSYRENMSDDDEFVSAQKIAKGNESFHATEEESGEGMKEDAPKINKQNQNESKLEENQENLPNEIKSPQNVKGKERADENGGKRSFEVRNDCQSESSVDPISDPDLYEYPDPEFKDFEEDRNEECFSVGQLWAVYDTLDAMPRFYALIRKLVSPGFKVRITWLEPDPVDQNAYKWVNEGLPTSCGKFKHGNSESTEDRLMFSHLVCWEKGQRGGNYKIVPRRGETWALFKNWNINWKSNCFRNRKFEYEFVEILTDYTEDEGVSIAYLGKVKGFVSLFCRMSKEGRDTFRIPPDEIFRFSHMIPSFKLTGNERDSVPKGSFELDPASLPKNIEEIVSPIDPEVVPVKTHSNRSYGISKAKFEGMWSEASASAWSDLKGPHVDKGSSNIVKPDILEYPDPEFFDFDAKRSIDKFRVGQIWALYCDEDGLPKYYGQITKIDRNPDDFKLQLRWLTPCFLPNEVVQWHDKDMPICCGRFKGSKREPQSYTATTSFSHELTAEFTGKKNEYNIWPRIGEVWALYRNWSSKIKCSDLENCEYDIVEVLERNNLRIKGLVLERVSGFNSVFKVHKKGGSVVMVEVIRAEVLRFSHQIPAFRLTEEKGGSMRGFWELDPAALPVRYFAVN